MQVLTLTCPSGGKLEVDDEMERFTCGYCGTEQIVIRKDVPYKRFRVLPPDPHGFDSDHDGMGCES